MSRSDNFDFANVLVLLVGEVTSVDDGGHVDKVTKVANFH